MATEILKLTKDCPEATIKSYFQGILKLTRENKEFPVDLDDVWMLAYVEKGVAVKALKNNFIENIDFIVKSEKTQSILLDQNVKQDLSQAQNKGTNKAFDNTQMPENQFFDRNVKKSDTSDKSRTKVVSGNRNTEAENGSQSTDNQFFHQKVENSKRGRPIEKILPLRFLSGVLHREKGKTCVRSLPSGVSPGG